MAVINSREIFKKAYDGGYAVGAFNVNNMELLQAITEAVKEEKAPLIIQVSAGARKYANHQYLVSLVDAAIKVLDIDLVLHLDHGADFEICKSCVDGGFSSVMIDGSRFPLEENIKLTKKVVEYAHAKGVSVEGELGKLAGIEDHVNVAAADAAFTDPEEAERFVKETGVDSLAVAIGTSHGAYKFKGEPKLDFERLEKIQERLPGFPLVLHGASSVLQNYVEECNKYGGNLPNARGVPENMISRASKMSVCKVNVDTDLRLAFTATIRKYFAEDPAGFDPRNYLAPARDAVRELVRHKLHVLGCAGKA